MGPDAHARCRAALVCRSHSACVRDRKADAILRWSYLEVITLLPAAATVAAAGVFLIVFLCCLLDTRSSRRRGVMLG